MHKIDNKKIAATIILLFVTLIMLVPLLSVLNISLKTDEEFLKYPTIITQNPQWNNFLLAWKKAEMGTYFFNSVFLSFTSAIISCLISAMAAFPLGRSHFKGSNAVFTFFIASMFFPGSLVATIYIMKLFHLYNTSLGVILLWAFGGIPINIFILTGFVKTVPRELDEAALMDGCGYLRYMFTIAFPLMKPALATVFVFKLIGSWNDFITPFLFLTDKSKRPLTAGLYIFKGSYSTKWTLMAASIILLALPMIIIYVFMQKFIIAGMVSGAIKG